MKSMGTGSLAAGLLVLGCLLCVSGAVVGQEGSSSPGVEVGLDKGFHLRTADGERKLTLSGYLQTLYRAEFESGSAVTNELRPRRARLQVSGTVVKPLKYVMLAELSSVGKASQPLLDAYAEYSAAPEWGLRMGQFKAPMSRQFLISASQKEFVEDSIASEEFKQDRDIGVMAVGAPAGGVFEYQVGVFNGSGKNKPQDNTELLYMARAVFNPLGPVPFQESDVGWTESPRLSVGAAGSFNAVELPGATETDPSVSADRYAAGGEIAFYWQGLFATAEGYWRRDAAEGGGEKDELGGYAQAGYFLVPRHLEVGARGAVMREDMDESGADLWEAGGVVSWFFLGHGLKAQLGYAMLRDEAPEEGEAEAGHRVDFQLQAAF